MFDIYIALQAIYPDYVPTAKPMGYWKNKENQKKFLDQLAVKWNIRKPEDWHYVTVEMVLKEGGNFIISQYSGSLQRGIHVLCQYLHFKALKMVYPTYPWKPYKPIPGSKTQTFLFEKLKTLLPESPIFSNAIISSENMIIEEEDQLRIFEFDVSFVTSTSVAD
jgi:hypothetical protein